MSRRINLLLTLLLLLFVSSTHANEKKEEKESGSGEGSEYLDIRPAIITNYGGPGPIHFVKVDMSLRLIKDPDAQSKVAHHLPHIRHELIMLLSKQSADNIITMESKEQLRQQALTAAQKVIQDEEGAQFVEDLLFTNFVVQN